eukprot:6755273-Prorocentrum_lima.AAC.1
MTSSLVGSEMCIRDRIWCRSARRNLIGGIQICPTSSCLNIKIGNFLLPVSYTHLTLPTICSV